MKDILQIIIESAFYFVICQENFILQYQDSTYFTIYWEDETLEIDWGLSSHKKHFRQQFREKLFLS